MLRISNPPKPSIILLAVDNPPLIADKESLS
jgi:hypothetical protein